MVRKINLKIAVLNAQSLNTGREELVRTMDVHKPDILSITETRISEKCDISHYDLPGYSFINKSRGTRRKREGGGVGLYVRSDFRMKKLNRVPTNIEQQWIDLRLAKCKIAVGVVYRPPKSNYGDFMDKLEDVLTTLLPQFDYLFLTGDINTDLLVDGCSQNKFHDILQNCGMHQIVKEPTRVTPTTGTLLDVICCNDSLKAKSVAVHHNDDLSDHAFIMSHLPIKIPKVPQRIVKYRPFNQFDDETFRLASSATPWDLVLAQGNVEDMVNCFNWLLLGIFDHFVPERTRIFTKPPSPWLTDSIEAIIIERDVACARAKLTKKDEDYNNYKFWRITVSSKIRSEKSHFF